MRRLVLLTCLSLAVSAAVASGASSAARGTGVPFKGTVAGPGTLELATGRLHAVVTGELTHFGRATLVEDIQITPGRDGTLLWAGGWSLTAANGDQMSGTSAGTGRFTDASGGTSTWSVDFRSTNGTGRFTGKSLNFHAAAVATTTAATPTLLSADVVAEFDGALGH